MSDDGWDLNQLAARVARLEAWRRRVVGADKPVPVPEPSELDKALAACKVAGVPEATVAVLVAEHGADTEALVGYLEEVSGDLRARARRGGIDLDRED